MRKIWLVGLSALLLSMNAFARIPEAKTQVADPVQTAGWIYYDRYVCEATCIVTTIYFEPIMIGRYRGVDYKRSAELSETARSKSEAFEAIEASCKKRRGTLVSAYQINGLHEITGYDRATKSASCAGYDVGMNESKVTRPNTQTAELPQAAGAAR